MHWADTYVGRPAQGKRPCWLLVRQVWIDRLGFTLPSYEDGTVSVAIARNESTFREVARGEQKELDAVMMTVPARDDSHPRGFRAVEAHIGVMVSKDLVLHVEEGRTAVVEPLKQLHVSRIMRGPWGEKSA